MRLRINVWLAVAANFVTAGLTVAAILALSSLSSMATEARQGQLGEAILPWTEGGETMYDPTRVASSSVDELSRLEGGVKVVELSDGAMVLIVVKDGKLFTEVVKPASEGAKKAAAKAERRRMEALEAAKAADLEARSLVED